MNNLELDKHNLRQVILSYPNQLSMGTAFATGLKVKKEEEKKFSNLIICGMGGSALPGDLLKSYLEHQKEAFDLPIYISRTYSLPTAASKDSLIFVSSYSGGTEETVSCFKEALEIEGATIVAFSAGGKIEDLARLNNVPHVKYQIDYEFFQPRYASTYAFAAMHEALTKFGICTRIKSFPQIETRELEVKGEELAKRAKNKIPVIYASDRFKFVAKTWKIKINENSNMQAIWSYLPEANHNELEGFSEPRADYFNVILREDSDHPRVKERMKVTNEFYQKWGIESEIIDLEGKSFLDRTLKGILLGDWFSYYLALEYGIDPTPSDVVQAFKETLG